MFSAYCQYDVTFTAAIRDLHHQVESWIRRRSDYIIGFIAPAIGPNKSKKLTPLIAPTHNIRAKFKWNTIYMASQTITVCLWMTCMGGGDTRYTKARRFLSTRERGHRGLRSHLWYWPRYFLMKKLSQFTTKIGKCPPI